MSSHLSSSSGFVPILPVLRSSRGRRRRHCCISDRREGGADCGSNEERSKVLLVEKYANGAIKRYTMDGDNETHLKIILEEPVSQSDKFEASDAIGHDNELLWLPNIVKDFVFPSGFPGSVSDDYLEYMIWQFPTNVSAWVCHALVTSSLLKGVGVGSFSGSTAAASAAAIRWVSKDGIGSLGRFFIGGRFGNLFDDDPKQWRMYADFIGSVGSIFDLTTPVYPAYFLPLASLGNLTKAVARGLKDPSFRVIQNHFAIAGNLGDVAAKEEVWEVSAQLLGLALGVIILDASGVQKSYPVLLCIWVGMRMLHLWFRYKSLSVLRFGTINMKRARILIESHIMNSKLPGSAECNRKEDILIWQWFLKPQIVIGESLEDMLQGMRSKYKLKEVIKLYENEKYILVANQNQGDLQVFISFKLGATGLSALRSVWQAYWINQNWSREGPSLDLLEQSVMELNAQFEDFIRQLEGAGWDLNKITIRIPKDIIIDELDVV